MRRRQMKTFKATACFTEYCTVEFEAEDEDQAYEMAREMDGGSFTNTDRGDWRIVDVEEIEQ
jgi:hypothetical protein